MYPGSRLRLRVDMRLSNWAHTGACIFLSLFPREKKKLDVVITGAGLLMKRDVHCGGNAPRFWYTSPGVSLMESFGTSEVGSIDQFQGRAGFIVVLQNVTRVNFRDGWANALNYVKGKHRDVSVPGRAPVTAIWLKTMRTET
jgi:hypothetical protein